MSRERIAQVLKSKRKESALSVEAVAEKLKTLFGIEISAKSLYSYESGHRQPDADLLMALCDVYGITDVMETFRDPKEKSPPPEKPVDEETRKEVTNIVMDMVTKLGWIEENGDISDAHRKMLEIILLTIQLGSADPTKQ